MIYDRDDADLISKEAAECVENLYFSVSPFVKWGDASTTIRNKLDRMWDMNNHRGCPIGSITYNHSIQYNVIYSPPNSCGGHIIKTLSEHNFVIQYDCFCSYTNRKLKSPRILILHPYGDRNSVFKNQHDYDNSFIHKAFFHYGDHYPYTIALDLDHRFIYMVYPVIKDKALDGLSFEIFAHVDPDRDDQKVFWDDGIANISKGGNSNDPFYIGIKKAYMIACLEGVIGTAQVKKDGIEIFFRISPEGYYYSVCSSGYVNKHILCGYGNGSPWQSEF